MTKFWGRTSASAEGQAYAEFYRRLDGREAVSIHVDSPGGDWSVVRLLRVDFEALLAAYRNLAGEESR